MQRLRFPSILEPHKHGYEYTNDDMTFWDQAYRTAGAVHSAAGIYDTLGDGQTQHTPTRVVTMNHFTDFCVSLAHYLLNDPTHPEIRLRELEAKPESARSRAVFLATVTYRDDKRQWLHLTENKVTTASAKQYDNRWVQVPTWADATIKSACDLDRINCNASEYFLERYARHDFYWQLLCHGATSPGDFNEKTRSYQTELRGDHQNAFRALQLTIQTREQTDYAKRLTEGALYNSRIKDYAPETAAA